VCVCVCVCVCVYYMYVYMTKAHMTETYLLLPSPKVSKARL
jgi:hypothetical protein